MALARIVRGSRAIAPQVTTHTAVLTAAMVKVSAGRAHWGTAHARASTILEHRPRPVGQPIHATYTLAIPAASLAARGGTGQRVWYIQHRPAFDGRALAPQSARQLRGSRFHGTWSSRQLFRMLLLLFRMLLATRIATVVQNSSPPPTAPLPHRPIISQQA